MITGISNVSNVTTEWQYAKRPKQNWKRNLKKPGTNMSRDNTSRDNFTRNLSGRDPNRPSWICNLCDFQSNSALRDVCVVCNKGTKANGKTHSKGGRRNE